MSRPTRPVVLFPEIDGKRPPLVLVPSLEEADAVEDSMSTHPSNHGNMQGRDRGVDGDQTLHGNAVPEDQLDGSSPTKGLAVTSTPEPTTGGAGLP